VTESINITVKIKNYGLITATAIVLAKSRILFLPWIILFGLDTVMEAIEWFFMKLIKVEVL